LMLNCDETCKLSIERIIENLRLENGNTLENLETI